MTPLTPAAAMDEQRLQEIENSIGLIDCPDCEQGRVSREGTFEDGQDYDKCETCDGSGMVSRFPHGHALIAEVRRLREQSSRWEAAYLSECRGRAKDFDEFCRLRQERDAAIAERDAAEAKIAGANMVARQMMDRLDGTQAALTEARRVLRNVQWAGGYISDGYQSHRVCPECGMAEHTPATCALAAVLAQEEQ